MKRLSTTPDLNVKIYSRQVIYFDDVAYSLSTQNKLGPLDILPGHASLISILDESVIHVDSTDGVKKFTVDHGLIKVSSDSVVVYVGVEDHQEASVS